MANDLLERIYQQLDRVSLLQELDPQERGSTILLTCPSCGKREAYLYADGTRIYCNRKNNCGYQESLWDYVARKNHLSPQETLRFLAASAGVELENSGASAQSLSARAGRQQALEHAIQFFAEQLFQQEGEHTLAYLRQRGWADEDIRTAGFGHYPPLPVLREALGEEASLLEDSEFSLYQPTSLGDTHRLVIPFRDGYGRAQGIIVRATESMGQQGRKYLFNRGVKRGNWLFGMDKVGRGKAVIVCEGFIDVLMAQAHGIDNMVATGGSRLTGRQLEHATRKGIKRFILALDNAETDRAGREGALAAIAAIQEAGGYAYVAELPQAYKDPDEAMRAGPEGVLAFQRSVAHPQSAAGWAARMLLKNYDLPAEGPVEPVLRDSILDAAMAYAARLTDPLSPADFLGEIAKALRLPERTLALAYEGYAARAAEQKQRKKLERLLAQAPQTLHQEGQEAALTLLRGEFAEIEQEAQSRRLLRPYTAEELLRDLKEAPEGLQTGFQSLDALLTVPQAAITLVAARPSHGKTTFLTNLFLRMIEKYPQGSFAFFSYEETRVALALNMVNILGGHALHARKNKYALQQYFKTGGDLSGHKVPVLDKAWEKFSHYVEQRRLMLFEENLDAEALAQCIQAEKKRNPNLSGVFIDYIQKIKWEGAAASSRQVELQRISGRILEAAKATGLPIILAAQLGRPVKTRDAREDTRKGIRLDNLRESGDIEQDANLVLGLLNETMDAGEERGGELSPQQQQLSVTILKNRSGIAGATIPLRFVPQVLRVEDMPKQQL